MDEGMQYAGVADTDPEVTLRSGIGVSLDRNNQIAQNGTNPLVRYPSYCCLTGMEHEARLGYLCYQAARNNLTADEECELLGYIVINPNIWILIEIERWLQKLE